MNFEHIDPFYPPLPIKDATGAYNYMSTPVIYGILRHLCMETGGPYLEIGSYRGMGLVACSEVCRAVGIDNFSGVGYRKENGKILMDQIKGKNAELIFDDYRKACELLYEQGEQFNVIFVDGPHQPGDTTSQLISISPLLKTFGFVVIDDYNKQCVADETDLFSFRSNGRYPLRFSSRPGFIDPNIWWNGIAILQKIAS